MENRFREDLYYRIAVITLKLPPLRERKSDIPVLAHSFLKKINDDFRKQDPGYAHKSLSVAALDFAKKYHWPGNIRQLYNSVLQAAVMTDNDLIDRRDMIATIGEMDPAANSINLEQPLGDGFNLDEHMDTIHRHYLTRAMNEAKGVKTHAARLLGLRNYQTLDAQLKRLSVDFINAKP
jgi:DNA-binding NtrC family response regulator